MPFFPDDFATDSWRARLGEQLVGFDEPSLYYLSRDPKRVVARFLWLRTFHAPVCVRLDMASEPNLVAKTAKTKAGFERPRDVSVRTRRLDLVDAESAVHAVREALLREYRGQLVIDGSSWLLELVRGGVYRVVERQSPLDDALNGPFRAAAWRLVELAGVDLVEGPVY